MSLLHWLGSFHLLRSSSANTYCVFIYKGILNRECYIKSRRECFIRPSLCKRLFKDVQFPPPQFYIHAFYYLQQNTIKIVIYTHIPPIPLHCAFGYFPYQLLETCSTLPADYYWWKRGGLVPFRKGTVSPSWMNPIMQLRRKSAQVSETA